MTLKLVSVKHWILHSFGSFHLNVFGVKWSKAYFLLVPAASIQKVSLSLLIWHIHIFLHDLISKNRRMIGLRQEELEAKRRLLCVRCLHPEWRVIQVVVADVLPASMCPKTCFKTVQSRRCLKAQPDCNWFIHRQIHVFSFPVFLWIQPPSNLSKVSYQTESLLWLLSL